MLERFGWNNMPRRLLLSSCFNLDVLKDVSAGQHEGTGSPLILSESAPVEVDSVLCLLFQVSMDFKSGNMAKDLRSKSITSWPGLVVIYEVC